jgi:hypothetical protein
MNKKACMKRYFIIFITFLVSTLGISLAPFCYAQEIEIISLHGAEMGPFVKKISVFYNTIFQEPPYYYFASQAAWDDYIQSYANTPEAVACVAMHEGTIIGAIIGTPMAKATERYRKAFAGNPEVLNSLFYAGELAVNLEFRGHQIAARLYQKFEYEVQKKQQFTGICVWRMKASAEAWAVPIFLKHDFKCYPAFQFDEMWSQGPGQPEVPHSMVCWIKRFSP